MEAECDWSPGASDSVVDKKGGIDMDSLSLRDRHGSKAMRNLIVATNMVALHCAGIGIKRFLD